MFELYEVAARSVAANSRGAVMELDTAYVKQLRLAADAVETIQGAGVPAGQSQKLLRTLHSSVGKLVDGRSDLVSAIGQLQVMQKNSNLAEVDLGCVGPWFAPIFTEGNLEPAIDDAMVESETA